jgi:hypothetical protein
VWLVAGIFFGGLFLLSSEDVEVAAGAGVLVGGWFAMFARFERGRQRRLVRLGLWDGVHANPVGRARAMTENRRGGPAGNG